MAKPNITQAILALFLLSTILCTKTLPSSINDHESDQKVSFSKLTFIRIDEICKDIVVLDFDIWFESFVPQYLHKNQYVPAFDLTDDLQDSVDTHIKQVKEHLKQLESKKQHLNEFAPLYLDIKVNKINTDINHLIHKNDVINPFASEEKKKNLKNSHGHYIPDLINDFNKKELDQQVIMPIGDSFKEDWDKKKEGDNNLISQKLEELAVPLRKTLKDIIEVYTNPDPIVYNTLTNDDKLNIQTFFDKFKFLLTPEEINHQVMEGLVPTEHDLKPSKGFLDESLFNHLDDGVNGFENELLRDKFLTLGEPEDNLVKIHKVAKPIFFSSEFNKEFDGKSRDLHLDNPLDQSIETPEETKKRKEAEVTLIFYKVYLFARLDGTLPSDVPTNNQEILKKLHQWVSKTDDFDDLPVNEELPDLNEPQPKTEEKGLKTGPGQRFRNLLPPAVFKQHFIPLLYLICSKIKGCAFKDNIENPEIIARYQEFDNFELLKTNSDIAGLVPSEIIDELNKQVAETELKKLDADLDDILNETPIMSDDEKDDQDGRRHQGAGSRVSIDSENEEEIPITEELDAQIREQNDEYAPDSLIEDQIVPTKQNQAERKKRQMLGKTTNKQVEIMDPIFKNLLPQNKPLTPEGNHFLDKILGTSDTASNPEKKAALRNILIKILVNRIKNNENKPSDTDKAILKRVNDFDLGKLFRNYGYKKGAALRNFFYKTINPMFDFKFNSDSKVERKFYQYDLYFFLYRAQKANAVAMIKKEKSEAEKKKLNSDFIKEKNKIGTFLFRTSNPNEIKTEFEKFETEVSTNPVLLERMPAYDFFIHFFSFFDYFEVLEEKSSSTYTDYQSVYLNFYNFLVSLRATIVHDIEHPHDFVLNHLEDCLTYTERINIVSSDQLHEVCKMSHRKYAEMYYFYKVYLLDNNKGYKINLKPYNQRSFDTHTRIFINFATQYGRFGSVLNNRCPKTDEPICVIWTHFQVVLNYFQNKDQDIGSVVRKFKELEKSGLKTKKFHYIAIVEAVFLNIQKGNTKDYSKILTFLDELSKEGINVYGFETAEVPDLTNYLRRTFKKLLFSESEAPAAKAIRTILAGKQSRDNLSEDSMGSYFLFNNEIYPDYIKLFTLLASSKNQFERIAEFIIHNKMGRIVYEMNNPVKHQKYINLINTISDRREQNDKFAVIRTFMKDNYENERSVCYKIASDYVLNEDQRTVDEYEELSDLLGEFELEDEVIQNEDEQFSVINDELIKTEKSIPEVFVQEQIIEVQVDEEEEGLLLKAGFNIQGMNEININVVSGDDKEFGTTDKEAEVYFNGNKYTAEQGAFIKNKVSDLQQEIKDALQHKMIEGSPLDTHEAHMSMDNDKKTKKRGKGGKKLI